MFWLFSHSARRMAPSRLSPFYPHRDGTLEDFYFSLIHLIIVKGCDHKYVLPQFSQAALKTKKTGESSSDVSRQWSAFFEGIRSVFEILINEINEECVHGELPESNLGERTDFKSAQKNIKEKALEGCKLVGPDGVSELLPYSWAQNEPWVRGLYTRYKKIGENFFATNEMFKWQKDLVSYLNEFDPDPRKILFIVDEKGNGGKSEIVRNIRYLFPNKEVFSVPPQDLVSMASLLPDDGVDIVILDCPRQKQYDLPYEFLENLKDGKVVQTKHQTITKSFATHVVVLMNRVPKTGKTILSVDRHIIKEIELEPEERARLDSEQEAALPAHLSSSVELTR